MNKIQTKTNSSTQAFTLIELLIVIAILAILATAVTLIINPQELIKQGRDSTRLSDLNNLNKALNLYQTDKGGQGDYGTPNTVYISLPDTSSTCTNHTANLPSLPTGWTYNCTTEDNLYNVDSTGWIPVDFTDLTFSAPISTLPIDPVNTVDTGNYYTYIPGSWYIDAPMESTRRQTDTGYVFAQQSTNLNIPEVIKARSCGDNGTFTDSRDGTTYQLTVIGEGANQQCWFAENLDYDNGCTNVTWVNSSDEGWCGYHTSDSGNANGLLYQWSAAMDGSTTEGAQGLCPSGWHIPTDDEFKIMEMSLGMSQATADTTNWRGDDEGAKLKQGGTSNPGWSSESCGSTTCNLSGWTATGGGYRGSDGSFNFWRSYGSFWSSSPSGGSAWRRSMLNSRSAIHRNAFNKASAFSVRCLRD